MKEVIKKYQISVLILDSLCLTYRHATHYSMEQAIELAKLIRPKNTYLVGMTS